MKVEDGTMNSNIFPLVMASILILQIYVTLYINRKYQRESKQPADRGILLYALYFCVMHSTVGMGHTYITEALGQLLCVCL